MNERELEIAELYKQGVSLKEICAKHHCSTNTISKIVDKFNIPRRTKRKSNKNFSKFFDLNARNSILDWIYLC